MNTNEILRAIHPDGKIPSRHCNYDFFRTKISKPEWIEFLESCVERGMTPAYFVLLCKNNITEPGKCKICLERDRMMTKYAGNSLSEYCSKECSRSDKERMRNAVKKRDSNPENKEIAKAKRVNTMMKKYGVAYNSQRIDVKPLLGKNAMSAENRARVDSYDWVYEQYVTLGKTHEVIAREFNLDKASFTNALRFHKIDVRHGYSISYGQRQIYEFIKSLDVDAELNVKGILPNNKEIDIYCPTHKFGIEYDGLYFHGLGSGYTPAQARYHQWKVVEAEKTGVRLIRITEEEWKTSPELIKSMIRHKIGLTPQKIFARKCEVREISSKESTPFLRRNHISGAAAASIHIGLFDGDRLVSVCTFGKPRFRKDAVWEIIRLASENNCSVVGGFQKLLSFFRKDHPGSIITYADRRISDGNVNRQSGFEYVGQTEPGYVWTDGSRTFSRYQTMRGALPKLLGERFEQTNTEEENMFAAGYKKYHNCGNLVFKIV